MSSSNSWTLLRPTIHGSYCVFAALEPHTSLLSSLRSLIPQPVNIITPMQRPSASLPLSLIGFLLATPYPWLSLMPYLCACTQATECGWPRTWPHYLVSLSIHDEGPPVSPQYSSMSPCTASAPYSPTKKMEVSRQVPTHLSPHRVYPLARICALPSVTMNELPISN